MTYESFFTGVGGIILGTLIGSWISCRMTYDFQKKLLLQQLDFQRKQSEADTAQREILHKEQLGVFNEFRNMINTRIGRLTGELSTLQKDYGPPSIKS
jgi:hypothetical protein